jgi:Glycosyl hydrolase family 26
VTRRAARPGRPRARPRVLAAVALIAAAGIILFVLHQQITGDPPPPHASASASAANAAASAASAAASAASASASAASAAASAANAHALAVLLRQGTPLTGAPGYWKKPSAELEAAAGGADDARFRALGALLVKDGFARAIIDLGREMTASWYNWSERKCPRAEPDCYALAWQHAVDAMRSVPGQHFRFLWTAYPAGAAATDAWPGASYVDLVGTDVYDWYGGPHGTYPRTASGQLDHDAKWRQILTEPGGLDWLAQLSRLTGKPAAIPEWGLEFRSFGGQDDPAFITRMLGWLHAHHAIGVYWATQHVAPYRAVPPGPLLAGLGAYAGARDGVNGFGLLLGGRPQYAETFLPDQKPISDSSAQPTLAYWQHAGYQLILGVPLVPLTGPSAAGPVKPGYSYQLADYPDALAAFRQGISGAHRS